MSKKSIKLEMKNEMLQWTLQKHKGSQETATSNYMTIKWTTQKIWTILRKVQSPKNEPGRNIKY